MKEFGAPLLVPWDGVAEVAPVFVAGGDDAPAVGAEPELITDAMPEVPSLAVGCFALTR
jgi:hypothetical protein